MKKPWIFILLLFISACSYTPSYMWKPTAKARDYIKYEEVPGMCFGQCTSYFIYIFDDGQVVYHGDGINRVKGLRKRQLDPALYTSLVNILKTRKFNTLKARYWYEDKECGPEYLPDQGELRFAQKSGNQVKSVWFDFGCAGSNDASQIRELSRDIRKALPIENWVGKKNYTWDYDLDFNEIHKEDKMKDDGQKQIIALILPIIFLNMG